MGTMSVCKLSVRIALCYVTSECTSWAMAYTRKLVLNVELIETIKWFNDFIFKKGFYFSYLRIASVLYNLAVYRTGPSIAK
jgi:hypothetical protein